MKKHTYTATWSDGSTTTRTTARTYLGAWQLTGTVEREQYDGKNYVATGEFSPVYQNGFCGTLALAHKAAATELARHQRARWQYRDLRVEVVEVPQP